MTPCEKLGYKVGDKFKVVDGTGAHYAVGSFITLIHDDGSSCPRFNGVHAIYESGDSFFPLDFVEKVAKLKPAKQALADAINWNGGWNKSHEWNFSTCNRYGVICFWNEKPEMSNVFPFTGWCGGDRLNLVLIDPLPNWRQCILSRNEYFTAYPEQLKVDINNETKHKVDVEMKSESEMTINASDWHKNGELPPVGEVCLYAVSGRPSVEVEITAHAKLGICFVQVGQSGESYVSKVAELHRFSPLHTERDKAIDEMQRIIEESNKHGVREQLGVLYDAGMRKEVK